MPPDQAPRRVVRTRTRPARVSNVIPFQPRPVTVEPASPPPRSGRVARLHDMARRCGLVFAPDGSGTILSPATGSVLFEQPACLDAADGTILLELFLGLYERGLLANRAEREGGRT